MKGIIKEKEIYYKTILDTSNSDTYTLNLNGGRYEVELYGGGAGTSGQTISGTYYIYGGGSGAGFKGTIALPAGTYTVTVGAGGAGALGWNVGYIVYGDNGGDTSLGDFIVCGGGKTQAYNRVGGILTYDNSVIISKTLAINGNSNDTGSQYAAWVTLNGGLSVYDNSHTGYGAGGYSGSAYNGLNGYAKIWQIVEKSDADFSKIVKVVELPKINNKYYAVKG